MRFWNDDYDDDLICTLNISLYIFGALRNSVSDRMAYLLKAMCMAYERSDLCFGFSSFVLGCSHLRHGSTVHDIKCTHLGSSRAWSEHLDIQDIQDETEYLSD